MVKQHLLFYERVSFLVTFTIRRFATIIKHRGGLFVITENYMRRRAVERRRRKPQEYAHFSRISD
ncbi:MAG TPA: hypothetical protein DDX91_00195 [Ruminococcaceae bacterium]|nr:hypothetical protein [Oscillospiraceae bacterium]